jgi:hypothetical protein
MKYVLFFTLLNIFFSCPVFAGTIKDKPIYVEGDVIVILKAPAYEECISMDAYSQLLLDQAETFAKKYGLELFAVPYPEITKGSDKNIFGLRSKDKSTDELIKELLSDPDVIVVEPSYINHKDPEPKSGGGCNMVYGNNLLLLSGLMTLATNRKKVYSKAEVK